MTDGLASRGHMVGSQVTRNRWLDDALAGWVGFAGTPDGVSGC